MSGNGAFYCSNYYGYHQCKNQVRSWGEKCQQCQMMGRPADIPTNVGYTNPFGSTSSAANHDSNSNSNSVVAPSSSEKTNPTRRGSR